MTQERLIMALMSVKSQILESIDVVDVIDFFAAQNYKETKFNDSVEMMLTKLDEFFSLVDMIRSDTSLCLTTTLPQIQEKCAEMEFIFDKIDKLEVFVNMVKDCVAATEDKVTKAENELGAIGGLVKKLTSFVSLKKSPLQAASKGKKPEYIPPEIFSTEDYLSPPAFNATQSTEEFGHSSQ